MNKTVIFLCGLIGSGKTTYAIKNFKVFTDLDYLPQYSRKLDQINWTKKLLKKHDEVCHITCYPTPEEIEGFKDYRKKYLLINPNLKQAKSNILIRSRVRDMENLKGVFDANDEYLKKYQDDLPRWEIIWHE